jgi:hypothetical protein
VYMCTCILYTSMARNWKKGEVRIACIV